MIHFPESIGVKKDKSTGGFALAPAIVVALLMLSFVAAVLYILISSLSS